MHYRHVWSPGISGFAVLLILALLGPPFGHGQGRSAEQQARELLDQVTNAETSADLTALTNLFSDDFTYVHSTGAIETKSEFLDAVRTKRRQYHTIEFEDVKVRLHGQTAILTGRTNINMAIGTREVSLKLRFTTVCVVDSGKWQMAAWQSTPIAGESGGAPPSR